MNKYLIKYIIENSDKEKAELVDYFKMDLDKFIYNYGNHINYKAFNNNFNSIKKNLNLSLKYSFSNVSFRKPNRNTNKVLSFVLFNIIDVLKEMGYSPYSSAFLPKGCSKIFGSLRILQFIFKVNSIISSNFRNVLTDEFSQYLQNFKKYYYEELIKADFKALFLFSDQQYFSKLHIDLFKQMNRRSFIFSHGLPGIYNTDLDNSADYLLVWGEKIKENYLKVGFNSDKVIVVGHPSYKMPNLNHKFIFSTSNILVIPKSSISGHQPTYGDPLLIDRSIMILYLYEVQKVLKKIGIEKATCRLHPSINKAWARDFIDLRFYTIDNTPLTVSLKNHSLIIGSTSSVFLEALNQGTNYVVFEPNENNIDSCGEMLFPPFDGSDDRIPFARNEEELEKLLINKQTIIGNVLGNYMSKFDISILKEII